jgi:hypothetical protein
MAGYVFAQVSRAGAPVSQAAAVKYQSVLYDHQKLIKKTLQKKICLNLSLSFRKKLTFVHIFANFPL